MSIYNTFSIYRVVGKGKRQKKKKNLAHKGKQKKSVNNFPNSNKLDAWIMVIYKDDVIVRAGFSYIPRKAFHIIYRCNA